MKYIIIILTVLLSAPAHSNPVPEFPFIILTEKLEKRVPPDIVRIRFNIETYDVTSKESLELLRSTGTKVLSLIKKHEIPTNQLESTQIDKNAKRARKEGVYDLNILGYETTQNFKLTLKNLDKYAAFMNELIAIDGVADINALFESTEEEKHKEQMINELSNKARKKADALAKAQSRKIKGVYGVTTQRNFGEAYAIFSLQYDPKEYARLSRASSYGMDLTMMVPTDIVVNQRMTVIYELSE